MRRELIYPFFIDCCEFTEDKFWKGIFEDLAYGIAPYGAFVSKGYIICNYKDKKFMYHIKKKEPQELFTEVYNLFTTKLNVMSKEQILNRKETAELLHEVPVDWLSIKKKNYKDLLIENWALKKKNAYHLSISQTKYLISIIFLGLVFKVFTSKDIILQDGEIDKIKGISFSPNKVNVERDIYQIEFSPSPDIITEKLNMSDEWEKYINLLK
jgi:hypothetical protein